MKYKNKYINLKQTGGSTKLMKTWILYISNDTVLNYLKSGPVTDHIIKNNKLFIMKINLYSTTTTPPASTTTPPASTTTPPTSTTTPPASTTTPPASTTTPPATTTTPPATTTTPPVSTTTPVTKRKSLQQLLSSVFNNKPNEKLYYYIDVFLYNFKDFNYDDIPKTRFGTYEDVLKYYIAEIKTRRYDKKNIDDLKFLSDLEHKYSLYAKYFLNSDLLKNRVFGHFDINDNNHDNLDYIIKEIIGINEKFNKITSNEYSFLIHPEKIIKKIF